MIIAQISDTHIALDTLDADRRIADFENTIADINALDPAPDVIVHTGDIVQNGRADEYAVAASILAKSCAPVYVMVGNKDNREKLRTTFSECGYLSNGSNFVEYAIEDYPIRLIALDTLQPDHNKGDFCEERAHNLIGMINAETTKPIAVFSHHPPFEVLVGPEPFNFATNEAMQRLRQALQHSGRVAGIFSGHVHRGTVGDVEGIPAFVMPSVSTTLRWDDVPPHLKACPVYYIHRFDSVGEFSTEARIAIAG